MIQGSRLFAEFVLVCEHGSISGGVDEVFSSKLLSARGRKAHAPCVDLEVLDGGVLPDDRAVPDRQVREVGVGVLPEEVNLLVAVYLRCAELLRFFGGLGLPLPMVHVPE